MQLKRILFIALIIICYKSYSQKFQSNIINDFKEYNPAAIGLVNDFQLNLRTNNFISSNYNYSGFNGSALLSLEKLNSTIGIYGDYWQDAQYKEYKNFRYGFSYAYCHSFSDNSEFIVGTKISIFSKRLSYYEFHINNIPYNEKEFKSDKLNVDIGIWYQYKKLGVGLSYGHVNSPELKVGDYYANEHLYLFKPELNVMLDHTLRFTEKLSMNNNLFLYDITEYAEIVELNMNNILMFNNTFLLGSYVDFIEGDRSAFYVGLIGGVHLFNKYKLVVGLNILQNESDYIGNVLSKRYRSDFECTFSLNF